MIKYLNRRNSAVRRAYGLVWGIDGRIIFDVPSNGTARMDIFKGKV